MFADPSLRPVGNEAYRPQATYPPFVSKSMTRETLHGPNAVIASQTWFQEFDNSQDEQQHNNASSSSIDTAGKRDSDDKATTEGQETKRKSADTQPRLPSPDVTSGQILQVLRVGSGLDGWTGRMHGGMTSLMIDEALGYSVALYRTADLAFFTVFLKITYHGPVPTPGFVLVRTWLDERKSQGRKLWVYGSVEDGNGKILAGGEALYVEAPQSRL